LPITLGEGRDRRSEIILEKNVKNERNAARRQGHLRLLLIKSKKRRIPWITRVNRTGISPHQWVAGLPWNQGQA
jgi:hypothetical protein